MFLRQQQQQQVICSLPLPLLLPLVLAAYQDKQPAARAAAAAAGASLQPRCARPLLLLLHLLALHSQHQQQQQEVAAVLAGFCGVAMQLRVLAVLSQQHHLAPLLLLLTCPKGQQQLGVAVAAGVAVLLCVQAVLGLLLIMSRCRLALLLRCVLLLG
jgi:hypothetical protein